MAAVVAVALFVLVVFAPTTLAMVDAWRRSSTYAHCVLIAPAFGWLVWQRRLVVASLPVRPSWWPMPLVVGAGIAWLAARTMAVEVAAQFALISMVPLAVGVVLGTAWVRALAFPLAFLFLAVPFGDLLVPTLQAWTAGVTVVALRLSGVRVEQDGTFFSTPGDEWAVIEACSGIGFLLASLAISSLYAGTLHRSSAKRVLFIAAALVAAIVANWLRAYLFVRLADPGGVPAAMGIDHIAFGWLVFGIVLSIVLFMGWRWRDGERDFPAHGRGVARVASRSPSPSRLMALAPLAVAAILCTFAVVPVAGDEASSPRAAEIASIGAHGGWTVGEDPIASWHPLVHNPLVHRRQTFAKDGHAVSVDIAVFGRPTRDSKLVTSSNSVVDPRWLLVRRGSAELHLEDEAMNVRSGTLVGRDGRILVWDWYWVDGTLTANPLRAWMAQMLARWQGRDATAAWVTICATERDGRPAAAHVLDAFASDMLAAIGEALATTARSRTDVKMSADLRSRSSSGP